MALFNDTEAEQQAKSRLEALVASDLSPLWKFAGDTAAPDAAVLNLERWLAATGNPRMYLEQVLQSGPGGKSLLTILGASQPLADSLIQNPELATLLLEEPRPLRKEAVSSEGRALLASSTSYTHSLDRLRFLRQKWLLPLVAADLTNAIPQEEVWLGLSDLADAIIELASEVVWAEYSREKALRAPCPIMVVGFGKLGGMELNYSSDVDLVLVAEDNLDEAMAKHAARYCEMLVRALADRMGRGALYRVDLRLRPFGGTGSIFSAMRAVEAYYRLHAEPWEVQALIRSRPVAQNPEPRTQNPEPSPADHLTSPPAPPATLEERWQSLRTDVCFKARVSERFLDEIVSMRSRVERSADEEDLKRGEGGIRDVEFLTQILQLIHGHAHEAVRVASTCGALRALTAAGLIPQADAEELIDAYSRLRKLEHRLQLVGDQQTHTLPKADEAKLRLARSVPAGSWAELGKSIENDRALVARHYDALLTQRSEHDARAEILRELGPLGPAVQHWFDLLPESEAYYASLAENQGSLERVCRIAVHAPLILDDLTASLAVTEEVLSGEVEEELDHAAQIDALALDVPLEGLAATFQRARTATIARWALAPHFDLGPSLSGLQDSLLRHCMRRLYASFDVVALGSYGLGDVSIKSDIDVLLLVKDQRTHLEAESQAQLLLSMLIGLKRHGPMPDLDLRLRPEGGKGLLVRTYEGLKTYELEDMEMWERFALGQCRLVSGEPDAIGVVMHCAYALPVTPERLKDLVAMKKRIETERVLPQHITRNLKLGHGGLSDIEWFVHLHEMLYPTATVVAPEKAMEERMKALARAQLINTLELDELTQARRHLLATRNRLSLLRFETDIVPENPDKLDTLAHAMGFSEGNAFLQYHTRVIDTVRTIYTEGLERLKA